MAKRGPKPYRPGCGRPIPTSLIARRLGISRRTVQYDLSRAIDKLRNSPLALLLFLTEVR